MLKAKPPICGLLWGFILYILSQYVFSEQPTFHLCMCTGPFWLTQSFSPCLSMSCVPASLHCHIWSQLSLWDLQMLRCIKNLMLALDEFWMSSNPSNSVEKTVDFSLLWGVPLECMKDICMFRKNSRYICTSSECLNSKSILLKKIKSADFSSCHTG